MRNAGRSTAQARSPGVRTRVVPPPGEVLERDDARLLLYDLTARTLATSLDLLGIDVPDQM